MPRWTGSLLTVAVLAAPACAPKTAPVLPTDRPPLTVASPPARVIVPTPDVPTLPPTEEPPATTPPATGAATPPRPRDTTTRATTPPPAEPPVVAPPPAVLTPANAAEFERRIRAQLARAEADLGRVSRASLAREARAQFDTAQGFVRQCHEALRARNLPLAGQLADKAATMAALLRK